MEPECGNKAKLSPAQLELGLSLAKIISRTYKEKKEAFANQKKSLRLKERNPYYLSNEEETEMNKILKQAEAEIETVPSSCLALG